MRTWSYQAVGVASLFVAAFGFRQDLGAGHRRNSGFAEVQHHPYSGSFYFGTSQEGREGARAWLIYLDQAQESGRIFVAPSMVKFSELNLKEDGSLTFQTEELSIGSYRFSGTLKAGELTGWIDLVAAGSDKRKYSWNMTAVQVTSENAQASSAHEVSPGRYSNVFYSDGGGDLVGVDIRFFSTTTGTKGMIVFYDDYFGGPSFTPLDLSHIEMDNQGVIQFQTESPDGIARYHLQITPKGALLNRGDEPQDKAIPLKKSRTALPSIW